MRTKSSLLLVALLAIMLQLTVTAANAGQATLSWTPPTTYTNGTPLKNLAGYRLHVGNTACGYQQHIDLGNVTSYSALNLTDGSTYYFAITAYDSSGAESPFSSEVYKVVSPAVTHTITATAYLGGTITAVDNNNVVIINKDNTTISTVTVSDGADQAFAVASSKGYVITDLKVDGVSFGALSSYTFPAVAADHTLGATFTAKNYTITSSAGTGGSISPAGAIAVPAGGIQTFSISTAAGYSIADVKVDGASVGAVSSYTFNPVTADHTIQAAFNAVSRNYTITASTGAGGSITPSGAVTVQAGGTQSFAVTPAAGFSIADVKIDGASAGPLSSYTFSNVTADHTIQATFKTVTYTITASAGTGGSIAPSGTTTVPSGGSQSYSISAAAGYRIADVKVDGTSVGSLSSYTFSNVTANHSIQATFTASATTTVALNCGGSSYTDTSGTSYQADAYYSSGSRATSTTATVTGTSDPTLYKSARAGSSFSYRVPVKNGNYNVTLRFAETQYSSPRIRVFSVAIGGKTVISNLDLYATAGRNKAYDVTVPATVTNGVLTIAFSRNYSYGYGSATVCAIKVAASTPAQANAAGAASAASNPHGRPDSLPPAPGGTGAASDFYTLPADRSVPWTGNAGVLGDIPVRSTVCSTLAPSGADDTAAIQGAITNCPAGQVVSLQSGTFYVSSPITVKSETTLRGAGMGATIIKGAAGMGGVFLLGFNAGMYEGTPLPVVGLSKGSTTLTTASAHNWKEGDIILIDQLNNPAGDPVVTNIGGNGSCFYCGHASGTRSLGQINRIAAVPSTTTATLEIPLYLTFASSQSPQANRINGITRNAGIEDLTVDNLASGSITQANDGATLVMYGASNCWFLRVEAIGSYETMVRIKRGYRNTIRSCSFHEGTPPLPPNGTSYNTSRAYGIWMMPASANLVENNKLYHLAMPVILNGVSSGNVVAYNYIGEMYYTNMNWNVGFLEFHGSHPYMNLFEGNYGEGRIVADDVWGSTSHNTFFRNRVGLDPDKRGARWDLDFQKDAQYSSVVANVIGTAGVETVFILDNVNLTGQASICRFGYLGDGDTTAAGNDPRVAATTLVQGNWDSVHNAVFWNGGTTMPLPPSLYLSQKPAWWGNMQWPAVGPDLSPMYPAAPGMCNAMPWDDRSLPSATTPSAPTSVTVQ